MIKWFRQQIASCFALREDIVMEITSRVVIITIFIITDYAVPFKRIIQPEEVWLYRFPRSEDFIPFKSLQMIIIVFSVMVIWVAYQHNRRGEDAISAVLGIILAMYLSACVTNFIKLVVGRPRPDFMARCFQHPPDDLKLLAQANCDRDDETVNQGYKSFPSGHATMALSGTCYMSLYIARSVQLFCQPHSRYASLKICASLAPLVFGVLVAASRTSDYHHHWQDVLVGSLIGVTFAWMCFRQSFQSVFTKSKHLLNPSRSLDISPTSALTDIHSY